MWRNDRKLEHTAANTNIEISRVDLDKLTPRWNGVFRLWRSASGIEKKRCERRGLTV